MSWSQRHRLVIAWTFGVVLALNAFGAGWCQAGRAHAHKPGAGTQIHDRILGLVTICAPERSGGNKSVPPSIPSTGDSCPMCAQGCSGDPVRPALSDLQAAVDSSRPAALPIASGDAATPATIPGLGSRGPPRVASS